MDVVVVPLFKWSRGESDVGLAGCRRGHITLIDYVRFLAFRVKGAFGWDTAVTSPDSVDDPNYYITIYSHICFFY